MCGTRSLAPLPARAMDVCRLSGAALRARLPRRFRLRAADESSNAEVEKGATEIAKAYAKTASQLSLSGGPCNWTCGSVRIPTPLIKAFGFLQYDCSSTTAPPDTRRPTGRDTDSEMALSITDAEYQAPPGGNEGNGREGPLCRLPSNTRRKSNHERPGATPSRSVRDASAVLGHGDLERACERKQGSHGAREAATRGRRGERWWRRSGGEIQLVCAGGGARQWSEPSRVRVSRRTVRAGAQALDDVDWSDQPRVAKRIHRIPEAVEQLVMTLRHDLRTTSDLGEYGARAIHRAFAARRPATAVPSVRTIGRILYRRGVLDRVRRLRRPPPRPGWYLPGTPGRGSSTASTL